MRLLQIITLSLALAAECHEFWKGKKKEDYVALPKYDFRRFKGKFMPLDAAETFFVAWQQTETQITFEILVKTRGYVAFGLSPNGAMKGSDIVVGWVNDDGTAVLQDRHGVGNQEPEMDQRNDYELIKASENSTHTTMMFQRRLDTCDDEDKLIQEGTVRLIWAYHPEDPSPSGKISYHATQRGVRSVSLVNHQPIQPVIPADSINIDLLHDKVEIPGEATTYWCTFFRVPPVDRKHHIIKMMPIVQPGSEGFVHHMFMYGCFSPVDEAHDHFSYHCYRPNMPVDLLQCNAVIGSWAVGGEDIHLPEEVGVSIGRPGDPVGIMMELHYDNPRGIRGHIDSSGMRFVATPTTRKYDSGELGVLIRYDSPFEIVPPYFDSYTVYGMCEPQCTQEGLRDQPEGIKIFQTLGHLHLLGQKGRLRHFRDGKELPLLYFDDEYDFDYQQTRVFKEMVTVLPGDRLVAECTYSSKHETKLTVGGFSTRDEMCIMSFSYYPRVDLTHCMSNLHTPDFIEVAGVTELEENTTTPFYYAKEPKNLKGLSWIDTLKKVDWTKKTTRDRYQDLVNKARRKIYCRKAGTATDHFSADNTLIPPPGLTPYEKPARQCTSGQAKVEANPGHVVIQLFCIMTAAVAAFSKFG